MKERQLIQPFLCQSYQRLFRTVAIFLLPALIYYSYWLPADQRLFFLLTRLPIWLASVAAALGRFGRPIYRGLTLAILLLLMMGNIVSVRNGAPYMVRNIAQMGFILHGFLEIEQGWTFLLNAVLALFTLQCERLVGPPPGPNVPLVLLFGAAQALVWFRWRVLGRLSALLLEQTRLNQQNQHANEILADCNALLSERVEERRRELLGAEEKLRQASQELSELHRQQHQLQADWLQAQRMDVLAGFAIGLAHSLSNTLTCIWGSMPDLKSEDPDALGDIGQACEKAYSICQRMMLAGAGGDPGDEALDLNHLLACSLPLLRRAVSNPVELEVAEPTAFVQGSSALLDQVIWNLVLNAAQASPPDLPVSIRTERRGERIVLSTSDRGPGIDSATRERMFEPFFTTRAGQGHGLGLAIVRQATEGLGGSIEVHSQPGQGTTFEVELPVGSPPPVPAAQPQPQPIPAGESRRVLLVEDQEALRRLLTRFLRKHDFQVEACASAEEAGEPRAGFDLLVTDVNLPGRDGVELAAQWAEFDPSLSVLFISGYPFAASHVALEASRWLFLAKPFKLTDLVESLYRLGVR